MTSSRTFKLFKNGSEKRSIDVKHGDGLDVLKSTLESLNEQDGEIDLYGQLVSGETMPDIRMVTEKRKQIVDLIKNAFFEATKKNLPIYHVPAKNLKQVVTTQKDIKLGQSRFLTMPYQWRSF